MLSKQSLDHSLRSARIHPALPQRDLKNLLKIVFTAGDAEHLSDIDCSVGLAKVQQFAVSTLQ